jgi:hypothetical protein
MLLKGTSINSTLLRVAYEFDGVRAFLVDIKAIFRGALKSRKDKLVLGSHGSGIIAEILDPQTFHPTGGVKLVSPGELEILDP